MMLTFINTDNWLLISLPDVEPKSEPISGMSFRIGTPVSLFLDSSPTKPPNMIDWPSLAWITVWIWRLLVIGLTLLLSIYSKSSNLVFGGTITNETFLSRLDNLRYKVIIWWYKRYILKRLLVSLTLEVI